MAVTAPPNRTCYPGIPRVQLQPIIQVLTALNLADFVQVADFHKTFWDLGYEFVELISHESTYGVVMKMKQIATQRFAACKIAKKTNAELDFPQNIEVYNIKKAFFVSGGLSIECLHSCELYNRQVIITNYGGENLYTALIRKDKTITLPLFTNLLTTTLTYYKKVITVKSEHGDLKPENIVYDKATDAIRFIDFGDWRDIGSKSITHRISRCYRTPSVAKKTVDGSATSFALGCVLAEILANTPLFIPIYQNNNRLQLSEEFKIVEHFLMVFNFIPRTAQTDPLISKYIDDLIGELSSKEKKIIDKFIRATLEEDGFIENRFLFLVNKKIFQNKLSIGDISPETFGKELVSFLKLMLSYDTPPDPMLLENHPFVTLCKEPGEESKEHSA